MLRQYSVNIWTMCKQCLDIISTIFELYLPLPKYCPNIIQILSKYCQNIFQTLSQHSRILLGIAIEQKQKLDFKLNCEKSRFLVSHKAYTRSKNRVGEMFQFLHNLVGLDFIGSQGQRDLLGNLVQLMSQFRGSVTHHDHLPGTQYNQFLSSWFLG